MPKRKQRSAKATQMPKTVIYRGLNFMPPRIRTTLRYSNGGTLNNAGALFVNVRQAPTNAYDIDPTLGSTTMPGFAELAAIYRNYRVVRFKLSCSFANKETFPVTIWMCPVNFDPGQNTVNFANYLSNRRCKKSVIGPLTGNSARVLNSGWIGLTDFGGVGVLPINDYYSSNVASSPANNIWIATGVFSGTVLASGVWTYQTLDIEIEFYELQSPAA
jgi:hypothetical protein